jgi:crotonobetainyl-CoA:carnitine CoA-transferase CaiB-like acyl-CoA transferase
MVDSTPLAGVRVAELGVGLSAAFCGRQFAIWGADVAVLGRPGRVSDVEWEFVATNKRVGPAPGHPGFEEAVHGADVILTDLSTAAFQRAVGQSLVEAATLFPGTVIVSITPYGLDGPCAERQANDLVVEPLQAS